MYDKPHTYDGRSLHEHQHPTVHIRGRQWSEEQTLHVATPYTNPFRWNTRRRLLEDFRRHMAGSANVKLHVGELAYGDRPWEVTEPHHPHDIQLRTRHELWHKENLGNRIIQHFDPDWKYGALIDGDFHFTRHDWALETVQMLQHFDFVQLFSTYSDLGPDHRPRHVRPSFAARWVRGELTAETQFHQGYDDLSRTLNHVKVNGVGTTGGAWAFRREAFEKVGGLLDVCILGSGDWHMAFGLIGEPDTHPNVRLMTETTNSYAEAIKAWQNRAARAIRKNIGVVQCHAVHHFHGDKANRKYGERWKVLRDTKYNPHVDIFRDSQGIWQLSPERPEIRDAIRGYFMGRNEDDVSVTQPPIA